MEETYQLISGNSPLLISIPHVGTSLPSSIINKLTPEALQLPDVDWHLNLLYDFANDYNVSILSAKFARYVIDLNRAPNNTSLYPGQDVTGLCPIDTFAKQAIYMDGQQPDENEIKRRIKQYWTPYHQQLTAELERLNAIHGIAILWDAHSIASKVPRFFNGLLPDLNFGTADSSSCDIKLEKALALTMSQSIFSKNYSYVFNGRFKGGYITRHYGKPHMNIHAIQLEMCQSTYMEEVPPYQYHVELALKIKPLLAELINTCLNWANTHK
jgi:N-formylglutamate deformylase